MARLLLQTLPVEIICHILHELDVISLLNIGLLNKHFQRILEESSRLQYTLALSKFRMISLPSDVPISFAHQLHRLQERQRRWEFLDWNNKRHLVLPQTGQVYEFMGGIYGNGRENDNRFTVSISFYDLNADGDTSSPPEEAVGHLWTHSMEDLIIVDFTMDPSQDLLVLVAHAPPQSIFIYNIHLRSLSTNKPHPEAALPVLESHRKPNGTNGQPEHSGSIRIQVSGDIIGFLIKELLNNVSGKLEIWNWKEGPAFSCTLTKSTGIDDFAFLSDNAFIIVRPIGQFEVYTFLNPSFFSNDPILRASYALPPLSIGFTYWYISMSTNPSPGTVERPGSLEILNRDSGKTCPSERILACCLYLIKPGMALDHEIFSFVFFFNLKLFLDVAIRAQNPDSVPQKTYSSHIETASCLPPPPSPNLDTFPSPIEHAAEYDLSPGVPTSVSQDEQSIPPVMNSSVNIPIPVSQQSLLSGMLPPTHGPSYVMTVPGVSSASQLSTSTFNPGIAIPWDDWGPPNTRWFPETLSTDWQHALYGLRTVDSILANDLPPFHDASISHNEDTDVASHDATPENENTQSIPEEDPAPLKHVRVRDYNPSSVRILQEELRGEVKGKGKARAEPVHRRVVTESSIVVSHGIFKQEIVSSLPYTEVISTEAFKATDVMIDDCKILILQRGSDGKLQSLDILSF